METREIPISLLRAAPWNANVMDGASLAKLRTSIERFGLVAPLLVRHQGDVYEVLSGNQRLQVLRDLGRQVIPCVVIEATNAEAQLLAQAMNHLHGQDDPGLEAELLRRVIEDIGEDVVLSVLPERVERLREISSLGTADVASYLGDWQAKQRERLRHFTARMSAEQSELVEQVLAGFMGTDAHAEHPNRRGNALYQLCLAYQAKDGNA